MHFLFNTRAFFLVISTLDLQLEFIHTINMQDVIDTMTKWKELGIEEIVDMQPFQEQIGQIE